MTQPTTQPTTEPRSAEVSRAVPQHRPLVTVIVPNYNYARVLPQCLAAIQAQTYTPLEILLVDDGSTDDSVRIAESMSVPVLRLPGNRGPAIARSTGAAHAGGEILFFVDSDVAPAPDAVANAVALLAADPRIGGIGGTYDPEPLLRDSRVEHYRALQHHYWSASTVGEVSFVWSPLFAMPAAVFAAVGPFNPRLRYTEELDYGERLTRTHTLWTTTAIRGRADHDRLGTLLRKVFQRCRYRVPLYARRRRFARGYERPTRVLGALAALLAVGTAALPLLLGPVWAVVPTGLLLGWLACDAGMYRFVRRRRGWAFTGFFTGLHLLVNLVIAGAVLAGAVQWLVSPAFRRYYDAPAAAAPVGPPGEPASG
jgi:glycosyltransferase involved in cell wall biosynthesis